jgi:hypothetical protein
MTHRAKWLLVTLGVTGMAGTVYAQSAGSGGPPSGPADNPGLGGDRWHHGDGQDGQDGRNDEGREAGRHGGWEHHHHRHHHHGMNGMMVHLLHQLNLTDAQKQSVHKILADARTQEEARRKNGPKLNVAALANPGDPKHAAALQDFQTRMAARICAGGISAGRAAGDFSRRSMSPSTSRSSCLEPSSTAVLEDSVECSRVNDCCSSLALISLILRDRRFDMVRQP